MVTRCLWASVFGGIALGLTVCAQGHAKPFTVVDDIELTSFRDPCSGAGEKVIVSPNRSLFFVFGERGRLDVNRPEDTVRVYRIEEVRRYLSGAASAPRPALVITRSSSNEGPNISGCRWLSDSTGIAFLQRLPGGAHQLMLADIGSRRVLPLTSSDEAVASFDVRDAHNYVYAASDITSGQQGSADARTRPVRSDERGIAALLFPADPPRSLSSGSTYLWAVINARRVQVATHGAPIVLPDAGSMSLALSPEGESVVTALPVADVPKAWEHRYPPPFAGFAHRIHAGYQNPRSPLSAKQYTRIDLLSGSATALTEGPTGNDAGWYAASQGGWSSDGQRIVLADAYLKAEGNHPVRPCIAVIDLREKAQRCLEQFEQLKGRGFKDEEAAFIPRSVQFISGNPSLVRAVLWDRRSGEDQTVEYRENSDGVWTRGRVATESSGEVAGLRVWIDEALNRAPRLVARQGRVSRVIWDPNPQLAGVELGDASIYSWRDRDGRLWTGGLYKPPGFKASRHYPLIIQTHGFHASEFNPSGIYTTAFAARALAAAGFLVLQVGDVCPRVTPDEGPCVVSGYDAAVAQLTADGFLDPDRVGIIGFSRSCYYVMEALSRGATQYRAASITDGVMLSYTQYLLAADIPDSLTAGEADKMIGAAPFGHGLEKWYHNSPIFHLGDTDTALLVVALGKMSLLNMWEPYAIRRYLGKPADIVMLDTDEHVITNPRNRLYSQGGSVDWFRFWLEGYEDPSPEKRAQYAHWEALCDLQIKQTRNRPSNCVHASR